MHLALRNRKLTKQSWALSGMPVQTCANSLHPHHNPRRRWHSHRWRKGRTRWLRNTSKNMKRQIWDSTPGAGLQNHFFFNLHFHFSLSCIGEGNGNPLRCSCRESPRDRGAWWAAISGVTQSQTRLKWLGSSILCTEKGRTLHVTQESIYRDLSLYHGSCMQGACRKHKEPRSQRIFFFNGSHLGLMLTQHFFCLSVYSKIEWNAFLLTGKKPQMKPGDTIALLGELFQGQAIPGPSITM